MAETRKKRTGTGSKKSVPVKEWVISFTATKEQADEVCTFAKSVGVKNDNIETIEF